jgi:hypothetical protein
VRCWSLHDWVGDPAPRAIDASRAGRRTAALQATVRPISPFQLSANGKRRRAGSGLGSHHISVHAAALAYACARWQNRNRPCAVDSSVRRTALNRRESSVWTLEFTVGGRHGVVLTYAGTRCRGPDALYVGVATLLDESS